MPGAQPCEVLGCREGFQGRDFALLTQTLLGLGVEVAVWGFSVRAVWGLGLRISELTT